MPTLSQSRNTGWLSTKWCRLSHKTDGAAEDDTRRLSLTTRPHTAMSTTSSRPAPPKPWEKAGAGTVASSLTSKAAAPGSGVSSLPAGHPTSGDPARCPVASSGPALPPRPADMTSGAASTLTGDAAAAASSALTSSAYNSSVSRHLYSVREVWLTASRIIMQYANRMGGLGTMGGYGGYGSSYGGAYSSPYSRFGGG